MSLEYRIGDVFDRLADIPDNSVDLIVTSPPFLALRSYLPADHPDKHKEIGSEPTPAEFLDTMLALTVEWFRVLAPHGSLCVELGDSYAGSNAVGTDHKTKSSRYPNDRGVDGDTIDNNKNGPGWPLAKSKTMLDTLYPACLAYGRNLLTGTEWPDTQARIRNLIVWARPNPPVGALGDKFRPATSYITVACKGTKRYFDLDAVRTAPTQDPATYSGNGYTKGNPSGEGEDNAMPGNPAGAPPLDWHADHHPEDGDWLWKLSTQPYKGSHYATFPMALPKRLIEAMCPQRVCVTCGTPSERITEHTREIGEPKYGSGRPLSRGGPFSNDYTTTTTTLGFTDCGHDNWRTGIVLDPFAGSGTTLEAAQAVGRHAIGIDLDPRNADLAQARVGMFLKIDTA